MKIVKSVLILLGFIYSLCSWAGPDTPKRGDWESSGGDGVACWRTPEEATKAEVEQKTAGLSKKTREAIVSLEVLDFYQFKKHFKLESLNTLNLEREGTLQKLEQFLKAVSPIFAERYQMASRLISFEKWKNKDLLPEIGDRGKTPEFEEGSHCRIIRLAERWSEVQLGKRPKKVYVKMDRWLYENKLNGIQQAILEIHERVYIIAKSIGQMESYRVRYVVAKLLQMLFVENARKADSVGTVAEVQNLLFLAFGEYIRVFAKDDLIDQNLRFDRPNQYTRFHAFARILTEAKKRNALCEQESDNQQNCSRETMHSLFNADRVSPEEAFTLVSWFYLFQSRLEIKGPHLLFWRHDDPSLVSEEQKENIGRACSMIYSDTQAVLFRGAIEKSKTYCNRIKQN